MKTRKLALALILALGCVWLAGLPAWAAGKGGRQLEVEALRVATKAGPLTVRVRAAVSAHVTIRVNGKRARHPFQFAGKHAQRIELRATDGLRPGVNRLRIRAVRHGRVYTARRSVRVPRIALLAKAGADAGAIVRARSRVGHGAPALASGDVDYRWRIAERPLRSRASLRGRDQRRPVLRAHSPGAYVLQLVADPAGAGPSSYDQVTVRVAPDDPPIGVPIETIDKRTGAISVGGESFGPGAVSYVVLDRETRMPAEELDGSGKPSIVGGAVSRDADGIAKLTRIAETWGAGGSGRTMGYLMIVSGRSGIAPEAAGAFGQLVKELGSDHLSGDAFASIGQGQEFSVIGVPGAPAGAATVRFPGVFDPRVSGGISGYLQQSYGTNPGGRPYYEYVSPEFPPFDTRFPTAAANTNVIAVGASRYQQALAAGEAGFHVLVLESQTLKPLAEAALRTNGRGDERAWQREAAEKLRNAIGKPGEPLLFVQTIGRPKGAGPEWQGIVELLGRFGANRNYVNALDGTSEYALASRLGSDSPPAEASTAYDHGYYPAPSYPPARLLGVMVRGRTSSFEPNVTTTPTAKAPGGAVNFGLIEVAYQPRQAWPELAPGARPGAAGAAQAYICKQVGFCQPVSSCPNLRDCYWQKFDANWTLKSSLIGNLDFPGGQADFDEQTFRAVRKQLENEAAAVANVSFYLDQLQKPFDLSVSGSQLNLTKISDDIWNSLPRPQNDNSLSWGLGLAGKIIQVGVFAGPPVSAGAAGLAASFGLASYLSNKSGQPIFSSPVKSRATDLGIELVGRINLARRTMQGLGMLIVSDSGKLKTASEKVDKEWAVSPGEMIEPIETASKQWFYEALIPTAFPYLIRGNSTNARNLDCRLSGGKQAWPNQPDTYQMGATVGYGENGQPNTGIFFFTGGIGGAASPSAAIGDEMFRPQKGVAKPGLGIEKLAFFTPRVFGGKIAHALNGSPFCQLGFLPSKF